MNYDLYKLEFTLPDYALRKVSEFLASWRIRGTNISLINPT